MYETPFHQSGPHGSYPPYEAYPPRPGACGPGGFGYRFLRRILMWMAIAFVAMLAIGAFGWAVGVAFHLLGLVFRIALVTAVVALVWRRITRRHRRNFDA